MNATLELFEQFKLALGLYTDNAAAKALGVKNQTVSNWRTRGSQAEPRLIELMCRKTGGDLVQWLMRVQVEQATSATNKKVWRQAGKQLGFKLGNLGMLFGVPMAELASATPERGTADSLGLALMGWLDSMSFSIGWLQGL